MIYPEWTSCFFPEYSAMSLAFQEDLRNVAADVLQDFTDEYCRLHWLILQTCRDAILLPKTNPSDGVR